MLALSNGDIYEGEFLNGLFHGNGYYFYSKDGVYYKGDWVNGKRQGQGLLYDRVSKAETMYIWIND
jgi:hypothetical protein